MSKGDDVTGENIEDWPSCKPPLHLDFLLAPYPPQQGPWAEPAGRFYLLSISTAILEPFMHKYVNEEYIIMFWAYEHFLLGFFYI